MQHDTCHSRGLRLLVLAAVSCARPLAHVYPICQQGRYMLACALRSTLAVMVSRRRWQSIGRVFTEVHSTVGSATSPWVKFPAIPSIELPCYGLCFQRDPRGPSAVQETLPKISPADSNAVSTCALLFEGSVVLQEAKLKDSLHWTQLVTLWAELLALHSNS